MLQRARGSQKHHRGFWRSLDDTPGHACRQQRVASRDTLGTLRSTLAISVEGLVYPGLGTVVFRDATIVPEDLLMDIDYLSGAMRNYSLNFSRASSGVVLQYYNVLRLGKAGYRHLLEACLAQPQ